MLDVSVYIVTFNEECHIGRCLESLRAFKEVIVVDSGSTDSTCSIVESFPNVRLFHREWPGYAQQKQWALDQCSAPWAFNLDADETVSPELQAEMEDVVVKDDADVLFFVTSDYFLDHYCRKWKIRKLVRFFRRSLGHYDLTNFVHEQVVLPPSARVRSTTAPLYHYGMTSISKAIEKQNVYSSLKAQEKYAKGTRASLLKLLLALPSAFFRNYFLKQDWRDGLAGFIGSVSAGCYAFTKEAKLFELAVEERKKQRKSEDA